MNENVVLKQIEIVGPNNIVHFDWKYVEQKRRGILDKAIEFLESHIGDVENRNYFRYYIIEVETEPGYLSAAKNNEPCYRKELSRKRITEEELAAMFYE